MNKFLAILAVLAILTIGTACSIGVPTSGSWSVDPGKGELTIRTTPWASTTVTGTNATPTFTATSTRTSTPTATATATATRTSTPTATTVPTNTNPITSTSTNIETQINKIMADGLTKFPGSDFDSTKVRIIAVIQEIDNLTGSTAFRWNSTIANPLRIEFGRGSIIWTQLANQSPDATLEPVKDYVLGDWGIWKVSGQHVMNNGGAGISLKGEKIAIINP